MRSTFLYGIAVFVVTIVLVGGFGSQFQGVDCLGPRCF